MGETPDGRRLSCSTEAEEFTGLHLPAPSDLFRGLLSSQLTGVYLVTVVIGAMASPRRTHAS